MKGKPLTFPISVSERYAKSLEALTHKMMRDTERQLKALYETETAQQYFATDARHGMDASITTLAKRVIAELQRKYKKMFGEASKVLAQRMVAQVEKESAIRLKSSLKDISGGLTIKTEIFNDDVNNTMRSSLQANADLIKTIPRDYLDKVGGAVYRSIASGNGLQDLTPFLEKQYGAGTKKARNVALDQTRKAYNDINADRMRAVGVKKFEWVHSGGGHKPREYHQADWPVGLNGGIFEIDNPPIIDEKTGERGLPGHAINCRCVQAPVLDFGDDE